MPSIIRGGDDFDSLESQGLGDGQTWQDLAASRALGVTYTNSTGRPISVFVRGQAPGGSARGGITLTINGTVADSIITGGDTNSVFPSVAGIVPAGGTYSAAGSFSETLSIWSELR